MGLAGGDGRGERRLVVLHLAISSILFVSFGCSSLNIAMDTHTHRHEQCGVKQAQGLPAWLVVMQVKFWHYLLWQEVPRTQLLSSRHMYRAQQVKGSGVFCQCHCS